MLVKSASQAGPEFLGTRLPADLEMGICYYILGTGVGREAKATELREQAAWRPYTSQEPRAWRRERC